MTEPPTGERLGTTDQILVEQPFLRRLARRLSHRDADADDLVQETMLRAYTARSRFWSGTSMRAWLATILRRLFLTSSIKEQRRKTHTETDLGAPLVQTRQPDVLPADPAAFAPDAALELTGDRIHRAFVRLPETYRAPFVLFALDGLSYAEIAGRLRVPIGTVMSRIHRARVRLRESALSTTTSEVR